MKKLGLALGSGGAQAFAHIGVLEVFENEGIPIDFLAGTSAGAVIAAHYALYKDVKALIQIANNLRKRDLLRLTDLNNPKYSLIKGNHVKDFLHQFFTDLTFDDTIIPLTIGATSLKTGSKVLFTKGKIIDILPYSYAFPGVFPAQPYMSDLLVDGGLADPTPVLVVKNMGADVVIGVDLYGLRSDDFKQNTAYHVVRRVYDIMLSKLLDYEHHEDDPNIIMLRPGQRDHFDTFAFQKSAQYIKIGRMLAKENITQVRKLLT